MRTDSLDSFLAVVVAEAESSLSLALLVYSKLLYALFHVSCFPFSLLFIVLVESSRTQRDAHAHTHRHSTTLVSKRYAFNYTDRSLSSSLPSFFSSSLPVLLFLCSCFMCNFSSHDAECFLFLLLLLLLLPLPL